MTREAGMTHWSVGLWLGRLSLLLYVINLACAIASVLFPESFSRIAPVVQAVCVVAYVALDAVADLSLRYRSERSVRKYAIKDGYGVDIVDMTCEKYYNNPFAKSEFRYVVNLFESAFFTKSLLMNMIIRQGTRSLIAIAVLVVVMLQPALLSGIPSIMAGVFSAYLVLGWVRAVVYFNRVDSIYEQMYQLLVASGISDCRQAVLALSLAIEYEATKAHYGFALSSSLFVKRNAALSEQWDSTCAKIKEPTYAQGLWGGMRTVFPDITEPTR